MRQNAACAMALACVVALACPRALPARQGTAEDEVNKLLGEGAALINGGRPRESLKPFAAALAKAEKDLGKDHEVTAVALLGLGRAYDELGDYPKAEPLYRRSLAIFEAKRGVDHPHVAAALNK